VTPPKSSGAVPRPPSVPKGTGRGAESATASGWAVPFRPGSGTGCNRASCGGGLPGVAPRPFGTPATTLRLWERRGGGPLGRQARRVTRRPRRPHLAKRARAAPPATRRSRLRRLHGVLRAAARATARVRKHSGGAPARTQSSRHRSRRPSVLRRGYRQWTFRSPCLPICSIGLHRSSTVFRFTRSALSRLFTSARVRPLRVHSGLPVPRRRALRHSRLVDAYEVGASRPRGRSRCAAASTRSTRMTALST
jgi:hypothetical protein